MTFPKVRGGGRVCEAVAVVDRGKCCSRFTAFRGTGEDGGGAAEGGRARMDILP